PGKRRQGRHHRGSDRKSEIPLERKGPLGANLEGRSPWLRGLRGLGNRGAGERGASRALGLEILASSSREARLIERAGDIGGRPGYPAVENEREGRRAGSLGRSVPFGRWILLGMLAHAG